MSTFLDDTNVPFNNPIGGAASDVWPWLDTSASHIVSNLSLTPAGKDWGHAAPLDSHGIQLGQFNLVSGKGIQPAGPDIWTTEPTYCSLQA